jgi:hypothetical protein
MKKQIRSVAFAMAVAAGLSACLDMDVVNVNNPDADRALEDASDVAEFLGGSFNTWWNATMREEANIALSVAAEELTSGWGNWNISTMAFFPRGEWPNPLGASGMVGATWGNLYGSLSAVNDALTMLDRGMVFGPNGRDDAMIKAMGRFMQGLNHAWLGIFFDQAYILDETIDLAKEIPEMQPYPEVFAAGMRYFDDALALAESNTFTLPEKWFGGLQLNNQDFARLIHSYKARFMTQVARTPEERAAVDWVAVQNHANKGITQNVRIAGDVPSGWWHGSLYYGYQQIWARVSYMVIGPADTTGRFEAWYTSETRDRDEFVMEGLDKRIHAPGDPLKPGTDFYHYGKSNFAATAQSAVRSLYLPNRYDHWLERKGSMPLFEARELDFIKAEAHIRLGQPDLAADLINKTRVARGGLEPVTGNDPNLMNKLIYEKRIELYIVGGGIAYFDARGWGLLYERTPLHFPVPGRDLQLNEMEAYTFGGDRTYAAPPRSIVPMAY